MKDGFKYVNQLNSNMIIVEGQSSYEENDGKLYLLNLIKARECLNLPVGIHH